MLTVRSCDPLAKKGNIGIMTTYAYIRTSRDQDPGHPGSAPHVQRR